MAYIINLAGAMQSIPNNSPLPIGARWADPDEVAAYEEADRIRSASGIPAPKSPQQAQLENEALRENIAKHGGLATPQERVNLETTAQQAGTVVSRENAPFAESADLRSAQNRENRLHVTQTWDAPEGEPRIQGRGETAGDQYTQYEPLPGVAKVVTEETPDGVRRAFRPESVPAPERAPARTETPATPATPATPNAPKATQGFSTPEERAKNSPTAKDKE